MSYRLRSQGPLASLVASTATHPRSAPPNEPAEGSGPIVSSTQRSASNIQRCSPACSPIQADQVTFTQALQLVATPAQPDPLSVSADTEVENILSVTPGPEVADPDPELHQDFTLPETDTDHPQDFTHAPELDTKVTGLQTNDS